MHADGVLLADAYLEHLSDRDLTQLVGAAVGLTAGAQIAPNPRAALRRDPGLIDRLLGDPGCFASIFDPSPDADPFLTASPFLAFAVAVHRAAGDLAAATFVTEWLGPRRRVPVFDVGVLCRFLDDPWHKLFLAELLASYTHVASGSVMVATRRGLRRQRFSELDPVRMAGLLELVPEQDRAGVYRRLGDLALFLTGVFPDHTANRGFGPVEETRLLRAGRLPRRDDGSGAVPGFSDPGAVGLLEELGRRWYGLAYRSIPRPAPAGLRVVGDLSERFGDARRVLNVITDRFLFQFRDRWFGQGAPA